MLKLNKNVIIVSVAAVLVFGGILLWALFQKEKIPPQKEIAPEKTQEELVIEKQLKELEELKKESSTFTEKEIQSQIKELEKFKKETKPLSQKEIQKQLEELEKLRSK